MANEKIRKRVTSARGAPQTKPGNRTEIVPAAAVSTEEVLRQIEKDHIRPHIAILKQTDHAAGSASSNVVTAKLMDIQYEIVRGKKVKNAAKKGHEQVHGTSEEKAARWQFMRDAVAKAYKEHPAWTWGKIQAEAAMQMGVSTKSIWRHVSNPKKNS